MTEMYSLTVLKTRRPKPMCRQAHAPNEDSWEESFPPLLDLVSGQPSLALLGLQPCHSDLGLHHHVAFSQGVCIPIFLSL